MFKIVKNLTCHRLQGVIQDVFIKIREFFGFSILM